MSTSAKIILFFHVHFDFFSDHVQINHRDVRLRRDTVDGGASGRHHGSSGLRRPMSGSYSSHDYRVHHAGGASSSGHHHHDQVGR